MPMIEDQALVASKHYMVETENKDLVCCKKVANSACLGPKAFPEPPVDPGTGNNADLRGQTEYGDDYWLG